MKFLNKNQVKFSPASFFVLREQDLGWEAFPKEICEANLPKPAKIKSFLIENFLSPALIKIKIFAGFGGRRQPTFRKRRVGFESTGLCKAIFSFPNWPLFSCVINFCKRFSSFIYFSISMYFYLFWSQMVTI